MRIESAAGLGSVRADPNPVDQAIINLAANARDAMSGGGTLTIETDNVTIIDDEDSSYNRGAPGEYVELTVSDTGHGMDNETRQRMFEPFFTKKPEGQGSGLGLAMVLGIVQQHEGWIQVDSEPGKGTAVRMYFPRVDSAPDPMVSVEESGDMPGGRETIMVVEDDPVVREINMRVLESLGYTVLTAESGAEGLDKAQTYGRPIDLLITNVVMPKMKGQDLALRFGEYHPKAKVFFLASNNHNAMSQNSHLKEGTSYIVKPYGPQDFSRKVRQVLDG